MTHCLYCKKDLGKDVKDVYGRGETEEMAKAAYGIRMVKWAECLDHVCKCAKAQNSPQPSEDLKDSDELLRRVCKKEDWKIDPKDGSKNVTITKQHGKP